MGQLFSKSNEAQKKEQLPNQLDELNAPESALSDAVAATPEPKKFVDPRSPNIRRTPIDELGSPTRTPIVATKRLNLTTDEENLSTPPSRLVGTQKNFLQEKLLKNLGYQAFDPRSPTQFINRTPMRWEANDDSFDASLINESVQPVELSSQTEDECADVAHESTASGDAEDAADSSIDKFLAELEIDPRSPSVNVERTPIVFKHNHIHAQDAMVAQPPPESICEDIENIATPCKDTIYEDEANAVTTPTTPKPVQQQPIDKASHTNRTPLSCLANKGRASLLHSNKKNMPKHPILFIGQQQQQPKSMKTGATAFGNNNLNSKSTKIPVFKNTVL